MTKPSLKKQTKRKVAGATARRAARGTAKKARREPVRAATIAAAAGLALALVGWLLARDGSGAQPPSSATAS